MILKSFSMAVFMGGCGISAGLLHIPSALAQTERSLPSPIPPPSPSFPVPQEIPQLPDLFPPVPPDAIEPEQPRVSEPEVESIRVIVRQFQILGSTVFSEAQLAAVTQPYLNRPLTFSELQEVRNAITQLYVDQGYITSGATLPAEQFIDQGVVTLQVIEGQLDDIQITGTKRLKPSYIRDRIKLGVKSPLNINQLLKALRYLQLNPLLKNISAELAASDLPGLNVLIVNVSEAESRSLVIDLNNHRSENIGSFQRQLQVEDRNLTGRGDTARLTYGNTDGSNEIDFSYRIPVNARDGSLGLDFSQFWSRVISEPFDQLNLTGEARSYGITFQQPIIARTQEELSLGASLERIESQTEVDGRPEPLSAGANDQGETRITQINVFQDWVNRNDRQIFALRSNFGIGVGLGATQNPIPPDGRFFQWQGQAQWIRQFAPDTRLLLRSNLQLSDRRLVPLVQFGLGGGSSVRGYPQDFLLVDNGFNTTLEGQLPILRTRDRQGLLQITPFVDYGYGWNWGNRPIEGSNHLFSMGLGLQWQWSDRLRARLDWGIPLISTANRETGFDQSQIFFRVSGRLF